ncbi:hypothetical protein NY08_2824 [Rhodococcus sp. B7740]|nr:hypothetical protein NY08_2824 [Rhodococcus sp. B7740]
MDSGVRYPDIGEDFVVRWLYWLVRVEIGTPVGKCRSRRWPTHPQREMIG